MGWDGGLHSLALPGPQGVRHSVFWAPTRWDPGDRASASVLKVFVLILTIPGPCTSKPLLYGRDWGLGVLNNFPTLGGLGPARRVLTPGHCLLHDICGVRRTRGACQAARSRAPPQSPVWQGISGVRGASRHMHFNELPARVGRPPARLPE